MSFLSKPHFHNEEAAFEYLESLVWADGKSCVHCGATDRIGKIKANPEKRVRVGLHKCGHCRKQFTVKVGTVFEHGRIPLYKMLQAVYLMTSSKKGISAHQIHRTLEITYKSAWFLCHRIREAMRTGDLSPMGGDGEVVEVDETYIGNKKGYEKRRGVGHKMAVLSLVQRGGGVRSFHIKTTKVSEIAPIVNANVNKETWLMSDEAKQYVPIGEGFKGHFTVEHGAGEYVDGPIYTNTIEGYYSIFKRGMKGVYQHCSEKHLHRYLAEYDFRYSNRIALGVDDESRSAKALQSIVGKRVTYQNPVKN